MSLRPWAGPHEELLAMVLANPDDDAPRQIYADALLEAGEPRGEFIAIQFKQARGEASADDYRELRVLYRDHERTWLGDLADILIRRVYFRGFIERAALAEAGAARAAMWEAAPQDERLATLRVLEPGRATEAVYRSFILSPVMRNLREVTVLSRGMLDAICLAPKPWGLTHLVLRCPVDADVLGLLGRTRALPSLRELVLGIEAEQTGPTIARLAAWPERGRLETLTVAVPSDAYVGRNALRGFAAWLSAGRQLAPVARLGLRLLMSTVYTETGDGGAHELDIEVRDDVMLADFLPAVTGIRRVVIHPPPREECCNLDNPRQLARALEALGAPEVELPERWLSAISRRG